MTLILTAIKPKFAFICADGAEFRHVPGQPKHIAITNRRKLFPVPNCRVVLAAHGQNKVHTDEFPDGVLIGTKLFEHFEQLKKLSSVRSVAEYLQDALKPEMRSTFEILHRSGIDAHPSMVLCVGFDQMGDRCRAFEVKWTVGKSEIVPYASEHIRLIHGGSGATFVEDIIKRRGGSKHLDTLGNTAEIIKPYIKQLCAEALAAQPADRPEFGGAFHSIMLGRGGWRWEEQPDEFAPE